MAIDNTNLIRPLLKFPNENSFYFLEILKRRKENPEMTRHAKLIRDFYIYSFKEFDELMPRIIELCEENNARAYFRLNVRDSEKIALQYNKRLAELLITKDYKAIPKAYPSVVGEYHSDPEKTWVIDLDKEGDTEDDFLNWITNYAILEAKFKNEGVWVAAIDTRNGVHLITRPFRLDTFREWAKASMIEVDVHKDNPTLLYIP